MEQNEAAAVLETPVQENTVRVDPEKVEAFMEQLTSEQRLPMGILGGIIAALVGAAIWAGVTVATKYQIGWMAVGVGFLVGYTVRALGRGISKSFGYIGGACALIGCLLGNLFSSCGFISIQESLPFFRVVYAVITQPSVIGELLAATFSPMDLLFYGIAVAEGYKFSFRQITEAERAALLAGAA